MKRRLLFSFLLAAGLCPAGIGFAAQPLMVEKLVSEVLETNPELAFYRAELEAALAQRREAGRLPNPELSADVGRKRSRGADLSAEGIAWSVGVQQTFEFPGRLGLRKAIADRQIDLAELGLEQFRAALAARTRALAYELRIAQERAAVAEEIESRAQELIGVLIQRDPAGLTPLLETRIIEASVLTLRAESLQSITEAQAAQMELNRLRGAPLGTELRIGDVEIRLPELPPVEELLAIAATNNFSLRIRQTELAQQGFKVELAKNERWPAIAAGPFYSQERAGEKEEIIGIGISVPVPLWNRNNAAVTSSEARLAQAQTALQLAQREVEQALRQNHLTYETYAGQIQQWRTNILGELRDAADLGDRHYRLGAVPVGTYVELQEKFAEGMEAVLETRSSALRSLQKLEEVTGIPLGARTALKSVVESETPEGSAEGMQ